MPANQASFAARTIQAQDAWPLREAEQKTSRLPWNRQAPFVDICMVTCSDLPFLYTAYGLTIASALECPCLLGGEGTPDVIIRYGPVPTMLGNVRDRGAAYEV